MADWHFNSRLVRNRKSICQKSISNKILCHLEFVTSLVTLVINLLIQICSTFDIQEEYWRGDCNIGCKLRHLAQIDLYVLFVTGPIYLNSCQPACSGRININQTSSISISTSSNNSIFHPSGRGLLWINIQTSIVSWIKNVLDLVKWLARSPRFCDRGY